jgi:hypothetical protein
VSSERRLLASRHNGRLGGPKTPEGKAASCLNARKHGIFASALTQYDKEEVGAIHTELHDWMCPVGPVEEMLVEKLALTYLRMQRCARAEAEYHISIWREQTDPYRHSATVATRPGGEPCTFRDYKFEALATLFGRYDTALTNQCIRLLHEIERLQRMRKGEGVPPPIVGDLAVHVEGAGLVAMPDYETNLTHRKP